MVIEVVRDQNGEADDSKLEDMMRWGSKQEINRLFGEENLYIYPVYIIILYSLIKML
jgi:hypothetical protein